ncbi:hypothetical protein, variant [Aphanomyces invadans]|uniref:OTU domain-containing protein n=1 Tax=Aphanomyces invadans TaxID=157072 RepID=A0A024ULC2_9STRA|nr:hypothetical protein, variant [Aphanomyces invadans]ETW06667.1 hypothetical protein, variant [Aphanomyces invadans]|eukprot:XP_008864742.1 hypothetical protein, variant [Aphanomyces invadans]
MESVGQMKQRHKLELRDLQGQTKALAKKLKKDNLSKKEIEQRVAELEKSTASRHATELQTIMQALKVSEEAPDVTPASAPVVVEEKSNARLEKAQRKRDKKRQEERDRQDRIAFESQNVVSQRQIEIDAISNQLTSLNLVIKEIPSDGHCMYHAVADQLKLTGRLATVTVPATPSSSLTSRARTLILRYDKRLPHICVLTLTTFCLLLS